MKLAKAKAINLNEDQVIETMEDVEIKFTKTENGSFTALVPVRLPVSGVATDTRVFASAQKLTLEGSTTVTKGGQSRTMLKASAPYLAINPDVANDAVVASVFDPKRSGGSLSAHLVIAGPKAMRDDFAGANGSTCQRAAAAQVVLRLQALIAMIGQEFTLSGYQIARLLDGQTKATITDDALKPISAGAGFDEEIVNGQPGATSNPISLKEIPGYEGIPGIDLTQVGGVATKLDSPIVRGLMGLAPLTDESVVRLNAPICCIAD